MQYARIQSRWGMIVLIGSLALAAAWPRPQLVSKLSVNLRRQVAIQLALATTPSHDPRHSASTLVSWSAALDRALAER